MNGQPEALRLADDLEIDYAGEVVAYKSAAELRRLYAANQELIAALKNAVAVIGLAENSVRCNYYKYEREFRALIIKIETQ
jgi:hypothetical protein